MRRALPVCAPLLLLSAAACGDDGTDAAGSGGGPLVVATTSIWADVVAAVACDGLAEVGTLVPPGGDPHGYEPSLQDRELLDGAAIVVANGLGLEETLVDTLQAVEDEGTPVFEIAPAVPDLLDGGHDDEGGDAAHDDEEGDAAHDGQDPHVWQDPARVAAALPSLGDALVTEAGLDRAAVDVCVETAVAELEALDDELAEAYAAIPADRRLLVTNHDALAYLADRYGLTVLGSVVPSASSLAETNPADLQALADAIAATGAPAVFAETSASAADADALAAEVGVPVVTLTTDTLGEEGSGAETYADLLRTNAALIVAALTS